MLIRYDGPSPEVIVGSCGPHRQGEIKDYADQIARELITTAKKQRFTAVEADPAAQDLTVEQLKADLLACGYDTADLKGKKKKDELVDLWIAVREGLKALAQG